MIEFTIPLTPITKKNSQQIVIVKGRPMIIPSKYYKQYEKDCKYFLEPLMINYPVNIKCIYYMPTKRRVDITNLLSATHDVLVKYKVIEDDNSKIVYSVDGSRVFYDKNNPRTEISIERIENEKQI